MKQRLKGLVCWWLVLVMLVSTLATPAMALPSNSIYIYAGTEPLKANDELYPYVREGVSEGTQLSSLVPLGDGVTLTGWNLWEFDNINSGYVITDKLLTKDTDWTLSADDVEKYATGDYYAFEPIYSGQIAIYTDVDEVEVAEFVGYYQVVSATTGVPVSEQASVIDVIDSSKTLEGWDIWSAGWSGYHSGIVWNERISEESADYTLSSKYFVTSDGMQYYLIPVYSAAPPHKHPICGAEHSDIGDHTGICEDIVWTAVSTEADLKSMMSGGSYYLKNDIELTSTLFVSNINLCLNGFELRQSGNFAVIQPNAGVTLNICDCSEEQTGTIAGGHNSDGAGIYASGGSGSTTTVNIYGGNIIDCEFGAGIGLLYDTTANIYNGKITGNNGGYGGVYCYYGATLNMYGGEISGNTATYAGGGIWLYRSTLNVSGDVKISGNTLNGSPNNLHIEVNESDPAVVSIDEMADNSDIGVTIGKAGYREVSPGEYEQYVEFLTGTISANGASYIDNFFSDVDEYMLATDGEGLKLVEKPTTCAVAFNANGGTTVSGQTVEYGSKIEEPTAPTKSGYTFAGWYKDSELAIAWDFNADTVTEPTTLYAKWTEKATITISDVQQQYDYSGEPIEFNLNSPLTGFTVKYRVKDTTTWSDSIPTEVNIYDVMITRAEDADYKAYEVTFFGKLVINKAIVDVPTIASKVYTGENQTADVPVSELYAETTNEGRTDVGTANVVLTLVDSANYKWSDGTETAAKTIEFEITKANENAITGLDIEDWTYGENAKSPTASATFGTPAFTYVGTGETNYAENATPPANAGTYKVIAKVADTANYTGASDEKEFAIAKATPTYTAPVNLKATYGETLVDVTLPDGWSWKDSSLSVGNAGTNEFTAVFTPQDTTNFEVVEINVSVAVGKTIPSYDIPVDIEATYGDTLADVTLPNGWSWKDSSLSVGNAGTQTFVAVFTPSDTNNYNSVEENITITVAKKEVAEPAVSGSYTYTGNEQTVTLIGVESFMTVSGNKATNAGNYVVMVTLDNNHKWNSSSDGKIAWSIAKADMSADITADGYNRVFDNQAHTISVDIPEGASIKYGITEGTYNLDVAPEYTNAGTSTVYYKVEKANYNEVTGSADVVINKKDITNAEITLGETLTYTGNELTRDFTVALLDGIEIDYTVSGNTGTDAGDYELTINGQGNFTGSKSASWSIAKATQSAPETPAAVNETIKAKADGKITGVNFDMEYKLEGASEYIAISETEIVNLAAGTYLVRYKETENYFASSDKQIVIADGVMLTIAFYSNEGTSVDSVTCEWNQTITAPTEPTKDGFEFISWYLDDTLTTKWTNEYQFTADTTLYAKWVQGTVSEHEDHVDEIEADGLNDVAKAEETDIKLVVQVEEATEGDSEQTAIKGIADAPNNFGFYDITLEKSSGGYVTNASSVIEIKLPYDFTRKTNIKVYRYHSGVSEELAQLDARATAPYVDGKCYVDKSNNCIYIYSSKFSTYAVAYDTVRSSSGGGTTRYTVKFDTNGGSSVSSATVTKNAKVAEPKTPEKDGYTFGGWYTDREFAEKYDFESKVTKNFTLYAKWDKHDDEQPGTDTHNCPSLAFDDLDITKWYHFDTDYVIENGIFKGTTETTFEPDSAQTRAMMVTVLYRVEGEPAVNRSIPFADVDMGAYYADAVIWGQQNGIIKGYSETEFGPDDKITREQIAAIMHRYAQYKGIDVSIGENTNILSYDDFDSISEYAIPSMQWAVGSGLIKGKSESTLNPLDNATRAEIAAILHRFIEANK